MKLYVFLRSGQKASLRETRWPAPANGAPGEWLETGADAPPNSIQAYPPEELPWHLDEELWEVELEGPRREGRAFVAERGRLLSKVNAWTPEVAAEFVDACAFRLRDACSDALARAGLEPEANELADCDSLDELERVGSAIARRRVSPASELAGFTSDAVLYARDATTPARAAGVASYVAAHALAGGDRSVASYPARLAEERRWQAGWLSRRLGLST